eukprot:scaffold41046_cov483-Skeletonema_dohrnii-CCMP3373.AAC.1
MKVAVHIAVSHDGWRDRHREQGTWCLFVLCDVWCLVRAWWRVLRFAEVSNGGSQDHNWECD